MPIPMFGPYEFLVRDAMGLWIQACIWPAVWMSHMMPDGSPLARVARAGRRS